MWFKAKTVKLLALFLGLAIFLGWGCGLVIQNNTLRISWLETTRRKLLLYEGPTVELFQPKKLAQTFVANYPGLSRIDILFNKIDGQQTVIFRLKNRCDSPADIVTSSIELPSLSEPTFYPFTFSPLDDSAGRNYCLILEGSTATPENAIQLQLSAGDLYPYGRVKVDNPQADQNNLPSSGSSLPSASSHNHQPYKIYLPIIINEAGDEFTTLEDIGFRLHYTGLLLPTFQVFITRLVANKPYIWGSPWFYGGLVILYVILLGGLFYISWRTIRLQP